MSEHHSNTSILPSERIAQVCLFLFAAIGILGGVMQMSLGEPDTTPRLDNIHRFLAGIYLACGIICLWTGITIRQHNTLVFLIALAGLLGATGRLISMSKVGLPEPNGLWMGYMLSEIFIPLLIIMSQVATNRRRKK